jgi:hypothetical protein
MQKDQQRLLTNRTVELERVTLYHMRQSGASSKNQLKPWLREHWLIPAKVDGEYVWRMEDLLEVYTHPYGPRFPQVCLDETSTQLLPKPALHCPCNWANRSIRTMNTLVRRWLTCLSVYYLPNPRVYRITRQGMGLVEDPAYGDQLD